MPGSTREPVVPPETLLDVRDLTVSIGDRRLVDGVSFSVEAREIVGLVGESGSGKTLSLLALLGLIDNPNLSVTGAVHYKGQSILGLSSASMAKIRGPQIAMIFQDAATALTPVYRIGWQIAEQIRAHERVTARAARDRALVLLGKMGFPDPAAVADRFPHELSGGMRQRAMIAMALSCNPALLIADEPTTALDMTVQAQILALIGTLRHEFGAGIVIVTHDMGVVAEQADRVLVMYAGRIVEAADKKAIFRAPRHPYTRGLLASIPPIAGKRPRRLAAIPGEPPSADSRHQGCAFAPRCPQRFARCDAVPPLYPTPDGAAACFLRS